MNPPLPEDGAQLSLPIHARPTVRGKFIFVGEKKLFVRGVTYGTFRPDANGHQFPSRETVERDFTLMAANGLNSVRTYTVPPRWLLDLARDHGLYVMVGLPWEQHITFLSDRRRVRAIRKTIRDGVRSCAGHPAVLCYSIGNEIPAPIVRWHGRRAIQWFLEDLYHVAKAEDPDGLVTYVNYPSTEYLNLSFADIFSFNVYLEKPSTLEGYLARLQNLAGNRPLLMAEIGMDSRRNGVEKQAEVLDWQVRTAFAAGCCGAFVFAWTDEWYRGGHDIEDWDFGVVTRNREPKPALDTIRAAFSDTPFPENQDWPRISVIVCTYNGSRTLRECLGGLKKVRYPDYEVILVDDGSRDNCADIGREFGVKVISTPNRGLSSARNTGMEAASGEIVVYLDDDAFPDPDWLYYLAGTFLKTDHAAVGGPNLAPPSDGNIAECVVNAPGGPVHVLLTDTVAEHIPGCNMAFRKDRLQAIGGFDTAFRVAGDDVDCCWRIQQRGWTIGFSPAALVWHHRRNSVKAYWKQQQGYGKAEALLERKWPEKYNAVGHIKWAGRLYGHGLTRMLLRQQHVYHGAWGSSPYQSLHQSTPTFLTVLPTMPEWYLVIFGLAGLTKLALLWPKLVIAFPLFLLAAGATIWQAILSASEADFPSAPRSSWTRSRLYVLTFFLHLVQPLARLWGRTRHGLTALRAHVPTAFIFPVPRKGTIWSETWMSPDQALVRIARSLRDDGAPLVIGGDYDRWDLEVRGGALGAARLLMTYEEHGSGKMLFRFRSWPKCSVEAIVATLVLTALALGAALDEYWLAYDILAVFTLLFIARIAYECGTAMAAIRRVIRKGFNDKP
ncbi:MAG TPA: glycosyltransferase [Verrucomicrobiota bacterium]|nr:glycosyltransferase [Verrucomicrobiota bacterium]